MVEPFVECDSYIYNYIFTDCMDDGLATVHSAPWGCLELHSFRRTSVGPLKPWDLSSFIFFGGFFISRWLKCWKAYVADPQSSRSWASVLLRHSSITSSTHELLLYSGWVKAFMLARSPKIILKPNLVQATSIPSLLKQAMELTLLSTTSRFPRAFLWNIKKQNQR